MITEKFKLKGKDNGLYINTLMSAIGAAAYSAVGTSTLTQNDSFPLSDGCSSFPEKFLEPIYIPEPIFQEPKFREPKNPIYVSDEGRSRTTVISYQISDIGLVELAVYNVKGQIVKRLVNEVISPGIHDILWDGKDESGNLVSSGIYFCVLRVSNHVLAKKIAFFK